MTPLLLTHHVTSALLAIICWWVAHEYARDRPPGRAIAIGWSVVGFAVIFAAFARHHPSVDLQSWAALVTKIALILTEVFVIVRFVRRRRAERG